MAGRLGVETAQPDRMHLELGGQQIADLPGFLVATLGEVLHPLFPFAWRPQPPAPRLPARGDGQRKFSRYYWRSAPKKQWCLEQETAWRTACWPGELRSSTVTILAAANRPRTSLARSLGLPDQLMGYVIERLVEAYLLIGGAGRLTTARPNVDVDHKDFIVDLKGRYRSLYIQVKGSPRLFGRQIFQAGVDYREGKVMSDPRLIYVFCLLDAKSMRLVRMWVIPASDFARLAPREHIRRGYVRLAFNAGQSGKWARFEIEPMGLGARILELMAKQRTRRSTPRRRLIAAA